MKKFIFYSFFIFIVCVAVSENALADEALFLKNGNVLYGKVISETNDAFVFKERNKGAADKHSRNSVIRILYNVTDIKKQYVYLKDGSSIHAYVVEEDANRITLRDELNINKEYSVKRLTVTSISSTKIENRKEFVFRFSKPAKNVAIEGDFTGWKTIDMQKNGESWEKSFEIDILKKNEYQYRHIVDGVPEEKRTIKFKLEKGNLVEDIDFIKLTLGVRVGYAFYLNGYADRIEAGQPMQGVYARGNIPLLLNDLAFQGEFNYLLHEPVQGKNSEIENLMIETSNFILGGYLVYDILFYHEILGLHPKIGGGYVIQKTSVSGSYNSTEMNSIPFAGGGLEFTWTYQRFVSVNLGYQVWAEIEDGTYTYLNAITLGAGFRF